jgi:hypothetical protein
MFARATGAWEAAKDALGHPWFDSSKVGFKRDPTIKNPEFRDSPEGRHLFDVLCRILITTLE